MKQSIVFVILLVTLFTSCKRKGETHMVNIPEGRGIEKAKAFGFQLSMQSYTFREFTLVETFERLKELEIEYIEIYPGHTIGGQWGDKTFDFDLTEKEQNDLKALAAQSGVKIVGCGVYTTNKADDWAKIFSFAKAMDMEYITCEPAYEHLDLIEKLSSETGLKVGIHNHPQPSNYWNPELLLSKIEKRSDNLGTCADVGHWNREGLDQVECLQQLKGRIQSLHFKDIDYKKHHPDGREYQEDTTWGVGVLDVDAMMLELKRQDYKGYLTIEYERKTENLMEELKDCIFYYDVVSDELFK